MPRASSHARGYNTTHQQLRLALTPTVAAGHARCTEIICLMPSRWIQPGTPWDLAHDRTQPGRYLGPAHARCNRSEGATYGNKRRGKQKRLWIL